MRPYRRGFTLIELIAVMALVGVLAAMTVPKLARLRAAHEVDTARDQLVATIGAARAAAVQKGRPARFLVRGNVVSASVALGPGDTLRVVPPRDLGRDFDVVIDAGERGRDSVITFEPRGFASPRLPAGARYIVRGRYAADTVCVGVLGQLLPDGCAS